MLTTIINPKYTNAVLDISNWQGYVNIDILKNNGIYGIFHKCTQGVSLYDLKYSARQRQVKINRIAWGAYHFGINYDGTQQAQFFLKNALINSWDLVALDLENNGRNTMNLYQAEDFIVEIYKQRGKYPLIYTSKPMLDEIGWNPRIAVQSIITCCPLWIAGYVEEQYLESIVGFEKWTFWQYTNGQDGLEPHNIGPYTGIDRDVFNGTPEELKQFWPIDNQQVF